MSASADRLVRRFYNEVWNQADEQVAREILHPSFRFRGSLGQERQGPEGFIAYMRFVHQTLGRYTCFIEDLVTEGDKVAARMRFQGVHQAEFFGVKPTGRLISWTGGAFFRIRDDRLAELWVIGDIDSIKRQLGVALPDHSRLETKDSDA